MGWPGGKVQGIAWRFIGWPDRDAAAFAWRFIGRPGRALLYCSFDPRINWATRFGRYSAAVLTRGFIGRPDSVVTLLQFWPEDSLGDPIRSLRCCSSRPRIRWETQVVTLQVTHSRGRRFMGRPGHEVWCICPRIHWATTAVVTLLQLTGEWLGDPVVALDSRPEILWETHHVSAFICEEELRKNVGRFFISSSKLKLIKIKTKI
jgi:hypothetical protein